MLICVTANERPKTVADVDGVVSAEIPDVNSDPFSYQSVCQYMIHGPCGEVNPNCPCMVSGSCSKHYPKNTVSKQLLTKKVTLYTFVEIMVGTPLLLMIFVKTAVGLFHAMLTSW